MIIKNNLDTREWEQNFYNDILEINKTSINEKELKEGKMNELMNIEKIEEEE